MKKNELSEYRITGEALYGLEKTVDRLCRMLDTTLAAAFRNTAAVPAYTRQLQSIMELLEDRGQQTDSTGIQYSTAKSSQKQKYEQLPSVPNLVKGSVLPANSTFRTSLICEAPAATEDLGRAMEDYTAGNMAGHEATLGVLRQILAAVSDISIGDEAIAGAVLRRQEKLAVVKGGQW